MSKLQAGAGHPAATMKCSLQPNFLGAELLLNTGKHRGASAQDAPAAVPTFVLSSLECLCCNSRTGAHQNHVKAAANNTKTNLSIENRTG